MTSMQDIDVDKLRSELAQEKQMKEIYDQSLKELQLTVDELEKRAEGIGEENNEWKTRYETQVEMNQQLEKQSILLQDKIVDAKGTIKENQLPRSLKTYGAGQEVTVHFVKNLEKEKHTLQNQLRDLEWRLDQESKAYHKANEERKSNVADINAAKGTIDYLRQSQTVRESHDSANQHTPRGDFANIPDDQRVLDPRMGPIKKTAAVKTLPRL